MADPTANPGSGSSGSTSYPALTSTSIGDLANRAGAIMQVLDENLLNTFQKLTPDATMYDMVQAQAEMTKNSVFTQVCSGCIKERGDAQKGVSSKFN